MVVPDAGFLIYTKLNSQTRVTVDNLPPDFCSNPQEFEIKLVSFFIEKFPPLDTKLYHIFCNELEEQNFFGGFKTIIFSTLLVSGEVLRSKCDFPYLPFKANPISSLSFVVEPSLPELRFVCVFHIRPQRKH